MDLTSFTALLFDVDRTLTNSKKHISQQTKDALAVARAKGWKLGLCTGRHVATLHTKTLPLFEPSDLHVVSGGAQIITTVGEVKWEHSLSPAVVAHLIDLADQYSATVVAQVDTSLYASDKKIQNWVLDEGNPVVPLSLSRLPQSAIPLLVLDDISDALITQLRNSTEFEAKIMKNYSGTLYADITAPGVSKREGLLEWCKMQSIDPQAVIGFGDSENDVEFLETVGYAVAMGNAIDAVKAIADEVTSSCDDNGVAQWIHRHLEI